jgi:hypothetical protein
MAVPVRMTAAGMDAATYDQASAQLAGLVKVQPGFMMHVAYPSPGGFSVEVWESRGQFETWFNENVKPNVPGVQYEVIELHAVVQPQDRRRQSLRSAERMCPLLSGERLRTRPARPKRTR